MSKVEKTLDRVLRGNSDANISFRDLCHLLSHFGFEERIRGSHHIFTRADIAEILNLQPIQSKAKPYQVKQVRNLILTYNLAQAPEEDTEEDSQDQETQPESDPDQTE